MIKFFLMLCIFVGLVYSQSVVTELPDEFLDPADIAEYNQQLINTQASNNSQIMTLVLELNEKQAHEQTFFNRILKNTIQSIMDSLNFLD